MPMLLCQLATVGSSFNFNHFNKHGEGLAMPGTTNRLIGKTARVAVPAGTAAALVLGAAFFIHHNGVHAADGYATAIDDNSVSALTSLDNAVETVAARVTPAVVNVAVTSRGSGEREASDDQ